MEHSGMEIYHPNTAGHNNRIEYLIEHCYYILHKYSYINKYCSRYLITYLEDEIINAEKKFSPFRIIDFDFIGRITVSSKYTSR